MNKNTKDPAWDLAQNPEGSPETQRSLTLKAFAKINLGLDVVGVLENGYHQVDMIMQMIDLHDLVTVTVAACPGAEGSNLERTPEPEIAVRTSSGLVPDGPGNLAWKAAKLMLDRGASGAELELEAVKSRAEAEKPKTEGGKPAAGGESESKSKSAGGLRVSINIEKNIPVAAGLAGGSGNAAAVMIALNQLLNLDFSLGELCRLGKVIGADVPFSICGIVKGNPQVSPRLREDPGACTCARARGIGEELTPLRPLDAGILLSKPDIEVSTRDVYRGIDEIIGDTKDIRVDIEAIQQGLSHRNHQKIIENMGNTLELFTLKVYPIVMYTKNMFQEKCHASAVLMSGSGPTVYGIYQDAPGESTFPERDFSILKEINSQTYLCRTLTI